jgi:Tfp pilus assembly protein FimT
MFSLLEISMSIGISAALSAFGLVGGAGMTQRILAGNDCELVASALNRARAEATHGVCTSSCSSPVNHGVYVRDSQILLFEGSTLGGRAQTADEIVPLARAYDGNSTLLSIFQAGTGASSEETVALTRAGSPPCTIHIHSDGVIETVP